MLPVEKCEKPMRIVTTEYSERFGACSACAGDYEDPDRTARPEEEPDEDSEGESTRDFLPEETEGQK